MVLGRKADYTTRSNLRWKHTQRNVEFDVKAELEAINLYKEIMVLAEKEGDVATKEIFEEIEEGEEEHHDFFTSLLEK